MGEYAYYAGQRIKIGTCENMYYLRADQVPLITGYDFTSRPDSIRFRFPFPGEDNIRPGQFDEHNKGIAVSGITPPEELEHGTIQFTRNYPHAGGLLVSLPCPLGEEGKEASYTVHKNGYSGDVVIVQQKVFDGKLILICDCGMCGARYRNETLEDAQPVIDALRERAHRDRTRFKALPADGRTWDIIADRILAGYTNPPAWVAGTKKTEEV